MTGSERTRRRAALAAILILVVFAASGRTQHGGEADPDELYRHREDLSQAARAADLWAKQSDFEAAWKLGRVCYWLGTHDAVEHRRAALDRGVLAGERAVRLDDGKPEGHFWLAANMGRLADAFGIVQGLKYRGRIREELERVRILAPAWQGGLADAALGEWYATVPRLLGGSRQLAESHLRRALTIDAANTFALYTLGHLLAVEGRKDEARALLARVVDAPFDPEWAAEDRDLKQQSIAVLLQLGK